MPAQNLIGTGLSIGGGLISGLGAASAERRANAIRADGIRQQDRAGQESAAAMGDFLTQLRASSPKPNIEAAAFRGAAGPGQVAGLPTASRRFTADAAGATGGARSDANTLADLFARIRAPGLQRQQEGNLMTRFSEALLPIQQQARQRAQMAQLRAGQQQANPWTQLLGSAVSNAGNYMVSHG